MAWYFNFCAPTLANDPIINIHRNIQTGCLAGLLFVYILIHMYYRICVNSSSLSKSKDPSTSSTPPLDSDNSDAASENKDSSDQNSDHQPADNEKSVSVAGGDDNSSYITFTMSKANTRRKILKKEPGDIEDRPKRNVTLEEVQAFFPIVFGHFAIACTFSIEYSPYAEQSIAVILYVILCLALVLTNAQRRLRLTRTIWGCMCFLICFLVMSGLIEVGQSSFNMVRQ
jgi:hypothetical protein